MSFYIQEIHNHNYKVLHFAMAYFFFIYLRKKMMSFDFTCQSLLKEGKLCIFKCFFAMTSVATGITKVAKSPFTLLPHLLRKVVTQFHQQNIT